MVESWPWMAAVVGAAADGRERADHTNAAIACALCRYLRAGLDHIQHRHRGARADRAGRHRRHGVAGHDQQFYLSLQQKVGDLGRILGDGIGRFHTIRNTRRVAKVQDALVRQVLHEGARHGETADPGVKYTDRKFRTG